jgi:hypothetical protein
VSFRDESDGSRIEHEWHFPPEATSSPGQGLALIPGCSRSARRGTATKCVGSWQRYGTRVMVASNWAVDVLGEADTTASGEPFLALIAARVPFDAHVGATGPHMAVVRTGTARDRIVLDLGSRSAEWTHMLAVRERSGTPWLRVRADDLAENPSMVRIAGLQVDWEVSDAQCLAIWRADPATARVGPAGGPDAGELLAYLSGRFPIFHSIELTGGSGTRGGSNMLWEAVGTG